ncbi:MAG: anaerobic ribonucleoside-triphosphate reductase activating protein [Erysipelotrichales bacterium]|nr:anaerobic ribonucleoside-triphosphate reductase activating protein [Erysipelotrichales bacterium]
MKIASITTCDINNGPGIRMTIWISGCSHNCPGCHNPELQDYDFGKYKLLSPEVFEKIENELNKSYIDGITFSGGDPLDQNNRSLRELKTFLYYLKKHWPNKKIWVYTGGTYEILNKIAIINQVLDYVDVLVDGLFIPEKRDITLPFRGSTNQRIIDIQESKKQNKTIILEDKLFRT